MGRFVCALLCLLLTLLIPAVAEGEVTFEVVLQGFTENPETDRISYVRMYINFGGEGPWQLNSEGIAGACSGWWEATESGMVNGRAVFMAAHDPHGSQYRNYPEHPLQDGRMFWVDCTAPTINVSAIQFWNAAYIGDNSANLYPDFIELVELTSSRAVFAPVSVPSQASTWTRIKALYR